MRDDDLAWRDSRDFDLPGAGSATRQVATSQVRLALQNLEQQPEHIAFWAHPVGQVCPVATQGGGRGGLPQKPPVQARPSQQSLPVVQEPPGPPQQRNPDNAVTDPHRKSRQHSPVRPEQSC